MLCMYSDYIRIRMDLIDMLKIGSKIELNEKDQEACQRLGLARYSNNRKAGIRDGKIGKQTNNFVEVQGLGGEFALCRLLDVVPDITIHTRSGASNDEGDLTLPNGLKVDVKTTAYKNGRLLAARWTVPHVDFYALMIGNFPRFTYMGSMTSRELLKDHRIGNLGYGETYMCDQGELMELI